MEKQQVTSEGKHTPLPWSGCHDGNCSCGLIFSNAADMVVAYVASNCKRDEGVNLGEGLVNTSEQFKANAKFIIEACNNYYSLKDQIASLTTELEQVKRAADHKSEQVERLDEKWKHWEREAVSEHGKYLECQKELQSVKEEKDKLQETFQVFKEGIAKGSELYAHLRFDDQPFTPYQLTLQENEKLKEDNQRLREVVNQIEELEIHGEGFLKAKDVFKIIHQALIK